MRWSDSLGMSGAPSHDRCRDDSIDDAGG
jgi:hypothetical protein